MRTRQKDWILMLVWPLLAGFICLYFRLEFVTSTLFFYVLPALYISFKVPEQIKKAAVMGLAGSLIWSALDYVWELTGAWALTSISVFKFFGVISVEAFIWSFFWIYYIIILYEYFFEKTCKIKTTSPSAKKLLLVSFLMFAAMGAVITFIHPDLSVPYSYSILGTMLAVPFFMVFINYPRIRKKLFHAGVYFAYATVVYEIVGLYLGYWWFPNAGQFLIRFNLYGFIIPLEEIIIWIILGSVSVISWYEFFEDDRK